MSDIENVIEDSINDALVEDTTEDTTPEADVTETETEPVEAAPVETEAAPVTPQVESAVKAPVVEQPKVVEDDFAKKFGIQAQSVTGKENRIPYSRVKKIVEKNTKDTEARLAKEYETKFGPQSAEATTRIKDYEERLTKVGQFEQVMATDPRATFEMLARLPAYAPIFKQINDALEAFNSKGAKPADATTQAAPPTDADPMPEPNKDLPDGSRVYDMDGLKSLMAWQSRQTTSQVNKEWDQKLAQRFGPIEQEWQQRAYLNKVMPQIDNQIAEARTWPNFNELEADIVKLLNSDPRVTLESAYMRAYQSNVVPRFTTDRNKVRSEILAEIKKQPASTAAPAGVARPKATPGGAGRTTEDVIRAALEDAGIKVGM